jgi:putative membrane protein insertion efficiency factor
MDVRGVWATEVGIVRRVLVGLALAVIGLYRLIISPLLPRCCRFIPSCSQYTEQALRKHGMLRGLKLSALRILRCHPFGGSGIDPVP